MSVTDLPLPPKVPGLPLIGCALQALRGDPRAFLLQQLRQLGPIFRMQAMHIDYLVMGGPEANQFVNLEGRECFESHSYWRGFMHELAADNFLIGLDGPDHLMLRKMFKSDFSKAAVDPHVEQLAALCQARFADLQPGQELAMVEPMLQLTSQMIGCVMTGKVPSTAQLSDFLYYVNSITLHFNLNRLPAWLLRLRGLKFRRAKRMTFAFAESVLQEKLTTRLSGASQRDNFVDAVIAAADQCPHLFAHGDQRFSAILPFFAGIDTLGQTLNYALFELHRQPSLLAQLQQEIDAVFSQGVPNTEQLKQMDILNRVIMETLRLHPSAFGMVRTAACDFEFAGKQVKKGQDIVILTTAPQHMAEYFAEPERFDIERFAAPRNEHRQRNVFAPFGRGPHTCLGAGMAESLIALSLGSILYHYAFEALDPEQAYSERINPTPSLGSQFRLQLKERRQAAS